MNTLTIKKIGRGYFRSGYGRTAQKKASIYLINGKCYARDRSTWETSQFKLEGELEGFVRVNTIKHGEDVYFFETNSDNNHLEY